MLLLFCIKPFKCFVSSSCQEPTALCVLEKEKEDKEEAPLWQRSWQHPLWHVFWVLALAWLFSNLGHPEFASFGFLLSEWAEEELPMP